jgi:hypothetical protein
MLPTMQAMFGLIGLETTEQDRRLSAWTLAPVIVLLALAGVVIEFFTV